jgi:cyclopropane-fatty-acyl-phospholipid synthase
VAAALAPAKGLGQHRAMADRLFRTLIRSGSLTVTGPDGTRRRYGAESPGVPSVAIRIADRSAGRAIARNPALGFGEMFMAGRLTVERGDIRALLDLIGFNIRWERENPVRAALWRPLRLAGAWDALNWKRRSRRNAAHHYDLCDELYALFLDRERQYSCAYFTPDSPDLDSAQAAKMAHVAAKLCLAPGQRLLDIGCGWGGLALHLARTADVEVLGIMPAPALPRKGWTAGCASSCSTGARSRAASTGSSASACSSMSARLTTAASSPAAAS